MSIQSWEEKPLLLFLHVENVSPVLEFLFENYLYYTPEMVKL